MCLCILWKTKWIGFHLLSKKFFTSKQFSPENEGLALDQDFEENWDFKISVKIASNSSFQSRNIVFKVLKFLLACVCFSGGRKSFIVHQSGGSASGWLLNRLDLKLKQIKNLKQHWITNISPPTYPLNTKHNTNIMPVLTIL